MSTNIFETGSLQGAPCKALLTTLYTFLRTYQFFLILLKHHGKSGKNLKRIGIKKNLKFGHSSDQSIKSESNFAAVLWFHNKFRQPYSEGWDCANFLMTRMLFFLHKHKIHIIV